MFSSGVTNRGNEIASLSYTWNFSRKVEQYTVSIGVEIWGESVSGYGAYNNGSTSGRYGNSLAYIYVDIVVPALPAAGTPSITVTGNQGTSNRALSISSVANATSYQWQYESSSNPGVWVSSANVNPNTVINTSIVINTKSRFRARAMGLNGVWVYSGASVWQYSVPASPSGLSASINATQVNLSWSNNAIDATSVMIRRSTQPDMAGYTTIYSGAMKKSHTDNTGGGIYYYQIAVVSPGGTTYSAVVSATTMQSPNPVSNITRASAHGSDTISLMWTNNPLPPLRPYSSITVSDTSGEEADLDPSRSTYSITRPPASAVSVSIYASNGAGSSTTTTAGPFYTSCPAPTISSPISGYNSVSATVSHSLPATYASTSVTTVVLISNGAAIDSRIVNGNASMQHVFEVLSYGEYHIEAYTIATCGGLPVTSSTSISDVINVDTPVVPVTNISYVNGGSIAFNIEPTPVAVEVRSITISIGGTVVANTALGGDVSGVRQVVILPAFHDFISTLMDVTIELSSDYSSVSGVSSAKIDLDKAPVYVNGVRHLARLVNTDNPDGIPISVNMAV
jgi:hypothetical protein